jgi:hypothetical protein
MKTLACDQIIPAAVARRLLRTIGEPTRDPQGRAADKRALADYLAVHGEPGCGHESLDVVPWSYRAATTFTARDPSSPGGDEPAEYAPGSGPDLIPADRGRESSEMRRKEASS